MVYANPKSPKFPMFGALLIFFCAAGTGFCFSKLLEATGVGVPAAKIELVIKRSPPQFLRNCITIDVSPTMYTSMCCINNNGIAHETKEGWTCE